MGDTPRYGTPYNPWRMFFGVQIPNWLLHRDEVSNGAKIMFALIARYAGKSGDAFPRISTLASELRCTTRQAWRYIDELRGHELIELEGEIGKKGRFIFLWSPWCETDPVTLDRSVKGRRVVTLDKSVKGVSVTLDKSVMGTLDKSVNTPLTNSSYPYIDEVESLSESVEGSHSFCAEPEKTASALAAIPPSSSWNLYQHHEQAFGEAKETSGEPDTTMQPLSSDQLRIFGVRPTPPPLDLLRELVAIEDVEERLRRGKEHGVGPEYLIFDGDEK